MALNGRVVTVSDGCGHNSSHHEESLCQLFPHIDNFVVMAEANEADSHFEYLGLPLNLAPSSQHTCLGIVVRVSDFTFSLYQDKLDLIYQECCKVEQYHYLSKRSYHSRLRSLCCACDTCVVPARLFLNRILALFRKNFHLNKIKLTDDF